MTSTQKSLGIAILVLVPILRLFLHYESGARYELWIDEAGYAIQTPLVSSNSGLQGADLNRIEVNPKDPSMLVAAGYSSAFFSRDGGTTWQELRLGQSRVPYDRPVFWGPDGLLYVAWGSVLSVSDDGAKTWTEYSDESLFQLGMLADGSLWGRAMADDYSKVKLKDGRIEKGEALTEVPPSLGVDYQRDDHITLDHRDVAAGVTKLPNGDEWAATAGGSYFRAAGQTEWQMRSDGQSNLNALYLRSSPLDPHHLLVLDSAHRLWKSSDFGDAWSLEDVDVQSVRYNPEGKTVLVYVDGRVTEGGVEIKPPREVKVEALEPLPSREIVDEYLSKMSFLDAGRATTGEFWILTSRYGVQPRQNYDNPFQRVASEWYLLDSNVLLIEKDGHWEARPGFELGQLEPGPDTANLELAKNGNGLTYSGEEIPNHFFFVGLPKRGGWLIPQDRYFMLGEGGLQVGRVSNKGALQPAVVWSWSYVTDDDLDRGNLRPEESLILESESSIRLLIPGANGLWRAEVPIREGWHWRWFAYTFTFSVWIWIFWAGFLMVFIYQWRRGGD